MSKSTNKFSPTVRQRTIRMVLDHAAEHPAPVGGSFINRYQDWMLASHHA